MATFVSALRDLDVDTAKTRCSTFLNTLSELQHSFSCDAEKTQNPFAERDSAFLDIYPSGDDLARDHKKFGGVFVRLWIMGDPRRLVIGLFLGAERAEQSEPRRGVAYTRRRLGRDLFAFERDFGFGYHQWTSQYFPWVKNSSRAPARQLEQFITFREEPLATDTEADLVSMAAAAVIFLDRALQRLKPIRAFGQAVINEYYSENLPDGQTLTSERASSEDDLFGLVIARHNVVLYGPPGTGKTTAAYALANVWQSKFGPASVARITFHPSYSYEDFVQGFRPVRDQPPGTFGLLPGAIMEAADEARRLYREGGKFLLVVDEINRADVAQIGRAHV